MNPRKCQRVKKDGKQCGKWPIVGRRFCNKHGGRAPAGADHHDFKHGWYSKHLTAEAKETFRQVHAAKLNGEESVANEYAMHCAWRDALLKAAEKEPSILTSRALADAYSGCRLSSRHKLEGDTVYNEETPESSKPIEIKFGAAPKADPPLALAAGDPKKK